NRGSDPRKLSALFRGELDWIVMKALEKDRNRRYDTAGAFAADVQRYLTDEPVLACPPSGHYRIRKFLSKHRSAVAATVVFALLLVAAATASTALALWANGERGLALAAGAEEKKARQEAMANLKEADWERQRAQRNFRELRKTVQEYFTLVSEETLLNEPALEPLRKNLLQAALKRRQHFREEHSDDAQVRAELAASYFLVARIKHQCGPEFDWLPDLREGVILLEGLVRDNACAADLESLQGGFGRGLMGNITYFRDPAEALRILRRARDAWAQLVEKHPEVPGFRIDLAGIDHGVGLVQLLNNQPLVALLSLRQSVAAWEKLAAD